MPRRRGERGVSPPSESIYVTEGPKAILQGLLVGFAERGIAALLEEARENERDERIDRAEGGTTDPLLHRPGDLFGNPYEAGGGAGRWRGGHFSRSGEGPIDRLFAADERAGYSHSIVAGGLSVMSYSTRTTSPESSRVTRSAIVFRTERGTSIDVAVIASTDSTIRTLTASP